MTDLDLDAIRAREQVATPGPWLFEGSTYEWEMWREPLDPDGFYVHMVEGDLDYPPLTVADGAFIAHARTDIPALIAAVQRRDDALAAVLAVHANYFDTSVPPVDACPEPEDVWRYDRDFRAAITAHLAPADNPTTED